MAVVSIKNCFFIDSCCSLVSIPNHSPETAILKVCRDYSPVKFNYFLFLFLDFAPVLTTPYSLNILPVSITRQYAVLSLFIVAFSNFSTDFVFPVAISQDLSLPSALSPYLCGVPIQSQGFGYHVDFKWKHLLLVASLQKGANAAILLPINRIQGIPGL